jgi:glycosyltransferase involved in cell wall biosynthesis
MINAVPVFSIVIPTYNQAGLLAHALQSVIHQTFQNWEAIVIDNYSSDNTREVVENYKDSRIRYVPFRNQGIIAASRNRGISRAQGSYIAFLDSDDLWFPAKLSSCFEYLSSGSDAVCHGMQIRRDGRLLQEFIPHQPSCDVYDTLLYEGNSIITTSTVVVKKEELIKSGVFSEDIDIVTAEDYDLWLRLLKNGVRWTVIPEILGEYLMHSANSSNNVKRQMRAEEAVFNRNLSETSPITFHEKLRRKKRRMMIAFRAGRRVQQAGLYPESILYFIHGIVSLLK